jgi:hypothetical protein
VLEIIEQKNPDAYRELFGALQTKSDAPLHLTEAMENGEAKGYILYAYEPEYVAVYAVSDGGDWNLCDGLVRSVLFKAELRGIEKAVFVMEQEDMLLRMRKLGFVNNAENILYNIQEIMERCEKCKENPVTS